MSQPPSHPPHPLSEATASLLAKVRRASYPPIYSLPAGQARLAYVLGVHSMSPPMPDIARVEDVELPGPAGPLRARLWAPTLAPGLPLLLYLHGGGFVVGGIDSCEYMCRQVALQSGAAVMALDYRLAPEHKFPAGLDDSFAALRWLATVGADELGLDPTRLALGGDSAGGCLAASSALMARDDPAIGPRLKLQALIYPTVQTSIRTESLARYSNELLLSRELMEWFDQQYRDPDTPEDWRRQPLLAPSHAGLAPAWIGIAECDALADDGRLYAQALRHAGVPVALREWPGVIHDFINMSRFVPEGAQAHSELAAALRQAFTL